MDKLMNAAQEYLAKDDDKPKQQQQQGYESHGGNYPAGAGAFADDDDEDDYRHAANEASRHAGSHGDTDLFSSVLGALTQKKGQLRNEDIDEDEAVNKHKKYFGDDDDDDDEKADDKGLGAAAAMQALKMFSSGQTGGQKQSQGGFAGLAMAEASRLFDQRQSQGKVADGTSKESAIQQAGEMALKMYFKSQGQQQGGIMGLASKFMK
ncbi:hypothetical protein COL516b_010830 [Colletotrichum fioriniae]|nr:uncharacterized protein COL516b_010830 [Colletotrichum fioriniae]KAJ0297251.1 hypothetical protein COL516b_010830 [Colletotrichum fioriniae]